MAALAIPGLDLAKLQGFLEDACPGMVGGRLRGRILTGGMSNLTYEITDGTGAWIVRRPPLGHVLATAHDMAREFRVMSALASTDVPVPATYALCENSSVIGAPFYVMAKVDGTPYRHAAELARLGAERTREISTRMIETLATLHRVVPAAVGLADFGRPEGFLARQVRRWKKQLDASRGRELPGVEELHRLLAENVPAESSTTVVHGDFRLDNVLIDDRDRVTAVLDWEMATLGDPLSDVGLLIVYQHMATLDRRYELPDVASAPGFLSTADMIELYAECTGRDLSAIGFYVGLAYFKSAVILEGIHYRYLRGQTVGDGFVAAGAVVEPLIEAGLTAMKEYN